MQTQSTVMEAADPQPSSSYARVILVACTLMIGITFGLIYSYSVFFKPLAEHFNWDRASVSLVYSLCVVLRGAAAIGTGWLADRYGPRKVMVLCGVLMAAGFLLSSQVTTLWQFILAYAVVGAAGMSGIFGIGTSLVSRWFVRNRGLALGIAASGVGIGTFFIVPGTESLVGAFGWSQSFVICGIVAGALMVVGALFLRLPPSDTLPSQGSTPQQLSGSTAVEAMRDHRFYLLMASFLFFFFGIQMVLVHIVNYATDVGISSLVAATFVSVIGIVSIAGRLSIGIMADRIGIYKSMTLTCLCLIVSFVILLFARAPWTFYLFAVLFSVPYGGEVTQIPLVIARFFGTRSMATLVGITLFVIGLGGAMGPLVAGRIYDVTGSYDWAFITGAVMATVSILLVLVLRQRDRTEKVAAV